MAEVSILSFTVYYIRHLLKEELKWQNFFQIKSEAEKVCETLDKFKGFLIQVQQDDNSEQVINLRRVQQELTKIAYDAEDVIDTYICKTESLSFIKVLFIIWRARQVSGNLGKLSRKLIALDQSHDVAVLKLLTKGKNCKNSNLLLNTQAPFLNTSQYDTLVGIEGQVEELTDKLTAGNGKSTTLIEVLMIVGMGGIGKTTLAKNIFQQVEDQFKYPVWIPHSLDKNLSQEVDEILRQASMNYDNKKQHKKETCLMVLDDVWDNKSLEEFFSVLLSNKHENREANVFISSLSSIKVIITSRKRLQIIDKNIKWYFHEMQLLSEQDSWYLFGNKISSKELLEKWEYHGLAREMLKKCGGLPLAIVTLGRLLKPKDTVEEWEKVFIQLVFRKEGPNDLNLAVNHILALSFHDLDYNLKPCFLYFAMFPQTSNIKAGTLMRMWIAEGFVLEESSKGKSSETAARELLQKLIDRTMVEVVKRSYSGKVKTLRLHDTMRALCIKEANELDFLTVSSSVKFDQTTLKNSRRAVIEQSNCCTLPRLDNSHLRSLSLYGQGANKGKLLKKLQLLRVLDINGVSTSNGVMPNEIGLLVHLRYLRIRSTNIRELPKSIGKLRKLETLDYWGVSVNNNDIIVPNVLWKLKQLKHLYLPYEMISTRDLKLHTITSLQTLWGIRGENWIIDEMPKLSYNLKKLCIQGISNSKIIETVLNYLITYKNLYSLALDWYGFSAKVSVLTELCKNKNLKKLKLMGKIQNEPPLIEFPCKLEKLELFNTGLESKSLKAIGKLKCLKFLRLAKESYKGQKWEIAGSSKSFRVLENLKLCSLLELKEWEIGSSDSFPRLRKLSINSCSNLELLPKKLNSILTLQILKIKRMPAKFNSRLVENDDLKERSSTENDFHIIKHIPKVTIRYLQRC